MAGEGMESAEGAGGKGGEGDRSPCGEGGAPRNGVPQMPNLSLFFSREEVVNSHLVWCCIEMIVKTHVRDGDVGNKEHLRAGMLFLFSYCLILYALTKLPLDARESLSESDDLL